MPEEPNINIDEFLKRNAEKDLLRFTTAGSVDDGKSTLIGRLLHDSKGVYEDQLDSVRNASAGGRNELEIDFSLLTDGLKAEREQGITIDVAYRYFSTPNRKFIIADTPGHEQYTRNMATGASTANLAVILIDARHGVLTQSKRHSFIASLLGIPHFLVAVNKMDLVDFDRGVFDNIKRDYGDFAAKLGVKDLHFIPISALDGDNVVERSERTPWYNGPSMIEYLENVYIASDRNFIDLRFPVQYVSRPNLDFRGYCGKILSGVVRKGDAVTVIPSMRKSRVKSIVTFEGELERAFPPQSVTLTLEDEIDVSRGDMLVHENNHPRHERHFEAMLVWMSDAPLDPAASYFIKHTTKTTRARVDAVRYKIDVNTLHSQETDALQLNEIGRVVLTSNTPLHFDPYERNRSTGSFILIDAITNNTVAAGMIIDRVSEDTLPSRITAKKSTSRSAPSSISADERTDKLKQKPATIWLTGLHACGKNELAQRLERRLFDMGATCVKLDGGSVRSGLSRELDFSAADRAEHLRRVAETAKILNDQGLITLCVFISPKAELRRQIAEIIGERFVEVYVNADLAWCEKRDRHGLYEKANKGKIRNVPGVDSVYEPPVNPDVELAMTSTSFEDAVESIVEHLSRLGVYPLA